MSNSTFIEEEQPKGYWQERYEELREKYKQKVDLKEVYDAYCKVCGHYHHTTPAHICRHACDYFKDFETLLNARKEK